MSNSTQKVSVTFPWATILFMIFLVLKLSGTVTWSWWWVTAPLWITVLIAAALLVLALILFGIAHLLERCNRRR